MVRTGLIQIYTGEGKGKTTAAVGLAVRAVARGLRVCYVSFHKDRRHYTGSEQSALRQLGVYIRRFASDHPMCRTLSATARQTLRTQCLRGLRFVQRALTTGAYDVVIADELNICVRDGYLQEAEVLQVLQQREPTVEVVLTGRGATAGLLDAADLVSYIQEKKHPYTQGIPARRGIEY